MDVGDPAWEIPLEGEGPRSAPDDRTDLSVLGRYLDVRLVDGQAILVPADPRGALERRAAALDRALASTGFDRPANVLELRLMWASPRWLATFGSSESPIPNLPEDARDGLSFDRWLAGPDSHTERPFRRWLHVRDLNVDITGCLTVGDPIFGLFEEPLAIEVGPIRSESGRWVHVDVVVAWLESWRVVRTTLGVNPVVIAIALPVIREGRSWGEIDLDRSLPVGLLLGQGLVLWIDRVVIPGP